MSFIVRSKDINHRQLSLWHFHGICDVPLQRIARKREVQTAAIKRYVKPLQVHVHDVELSRVSGAEMKTIRMEAPCPIF